MPLIDARELHKTYKVGDVDVHAIREVSFAIPQSAFVCFIGPSGSGKSTLLNMVGCLDRPTSGTLKVLDTDVASLSARAAADFRGQNIGFVFQDFNLIPVLTACENVEYPLVMVQRRPPAERSRRVRDMLEAVGMAGYGANKPDQLSGGQKQRVAIARALVTNPKLVLADEPTANLDRDTALRIIELMKHMRDEFGTTFLFSTHDTKIVQEAETVLALEDGRLSGNTREPRRAA
jgi:putative ABC transport system ATP-binding protein